MLKLLFFTFVSDTYSVSLLDIFIHPFPSPIKEILVTFHEGKIIFAVKALQSICLVGRYKLNKFNGFLR